MPLAIFLKSKALGQCIGISFIDSTPVRACHIKREARHKTLKGFAKKGLSSMGWFFDFNTKRNIDKTRMKSMGRDLNTCSKLKLINNLVKKHIRFNFAVK